MADANKDFDIYREIRNKWINNEKLTHRKFQWQESYGAFSYSKSQVDAVAKYVMNQQEHQKKVTFIDEYKDMLEKFEIDYDERYIFKLPEEDGI